MTMPAHVSRPRSGRVHGPRGTITVGAVITTYNRSQLVGRAIDSVLAQTRPVDEVVVVDDGSTDDTRAAVGRYGPPVRYVYQPNRGLAAARNTGARASRCDWVAFLDDDDEWMPEKTEKQIDALLAVPEAVLCYAGPRWVCSDGSIGSSRPIPPDRLWPAARLKSPIVPCTVVVNRDWFLGLGGFNEGLRCVEDWEFAARAAYDNRLVAVDEPLVTVHGAENTMSKQTETMLAAELSIVDALLVGLRGPSRRLWRRRILGRMYYRAAVSARERGLPHWPYLWRSLLSWPLPGVGASRSRFVAAALRRLVTG